MKKSEKMFYEWWNNKNNQIKLRDIESQVKLENFEEKLDKYSFNIDIVKILVIIPVALYCLFFD